MKVTIVTLYKDDTADYYCGAIEGALTDEQRREVAKGLNAEYNVEEKEDGRYVYFREVDVAATPAALTRVYHVDDDSVEPAPIKEFG